MCKNFLDKNPEGGVVFFESESAIRIVGYILIPVDLISAMLVLVLSEVVGIFEELV